MKTRQATASKIGLKSLNGKAKGRPLGFLVACLSIAGHSDCDSKAKHWDDACITANCTLAHRLASRLSLSAIDGGTPMMDQERPRRDGEGDEPEGLA